MSRQETKRRTLRGRDICAVLAVLVVGLGMINIMVSGNDNASGVIAVGSVGVAILLLTLGFGGGWMVDRFAERHPWAAKNRFSTMAFLLMPPLLVVLGVLLWQRRDTIATDVEESAGIVMTELERVVTGDNAP